MHGRDLRKAICEARLYVLLSPELCRHSVYETARLVTEGGADVIQLRCKDEPDEKFLELARELRGLTTENNVLFIINDRADIAAEIGADGVHVGQGDIPIKVARHVVGEERLIGVSAHNIQQALKAQEQGADYLGIGTIFPTETKPQAELVGVELIKLVAGEISIPFFAIGGINLRNIHQVLEAGATRVAVCSAVISQEDVLSATKGFCNTLGGK